MCNFAHQRIETNFEEVAEMPDDCGHASCALERLSRAFCALKSSARLNPPYTVKHSGTLLKLINLSSKCFVPVPVVEPYLYVTIWLMFYCIFLIVKTS